MSYARPPCHLSTSRSSSPPFPPRSQPAGLASFFLGPRLCRSQQFLKRKFAKHRFSATDVVEASQAFCSDAPTETPRVVQDWGSVQKGGNAYRGLMRRLDKIDLPPVYQAALPSWDPLRNQKATMLTNFLLPHEMLHHMVQPSTVHEWCTFAPEVSPLNDVLKEWGETLKPPRDTTTELFASLGLWGDSAPYSKRDSVYLLTYVCQCGCYGRHTFEEAWRVMGWSLRALADGHFPRVRHDQNPYNKSSGVGDRDRIHQAGCVLNCKAACIQIKGDWAWYKQAFGLSGWKGEGGHGHVCWRCPANNKTDFDFRRADRHAPWRGHEYDDDKALFMCMLHSGFRSEIFNFPGMRFKYILIDLMHVVCLGILQNLLGNCFWELHCSLGGNMSPDSTGSKGAVSVLRSQIRLGSKFLGIDCPVYALTLPMFRASGKGPKMKTKAGEGRHLLKVLLHMLITFYDQTSEHNAIRLNCVRSLAAIYDQLAVWDFDTSYSECAVLATKHVLLYAELWREAAELDESTLLWKMIPKHHLFIHLMEHDRGNPKEGWNYGDESEIGVAVDMCTTLHCRTIATEAVRKYRATTVER
ncbi:unnamed protein product [Prorocentrum cordatum]|uniref:Uncharacterized protein n=1 Tax=Prorocentrum cordatum TaxID=2364126 RepID=A0ABN9UTU3_9DINO|nr:unnamed protein product [Polarella glacialis]